jgi:translation initiation factor IF-3
LAAKEFRINEEILVREVRLIDENGGQLGIIATSEALVKAKEAGLDLIEVAPNANPPVCKILDYGKYKYDQEKRLKEAKKNQKQVIMKEIRMQPKIETHDLNFKTKHIREFLEEGNKVKVTVRFRGRELAHTELGKVVLDEIVEKLDTSFSIDKKPTMEGRYMSMILSPKAKK